MVLNPVGSYVSIFGNEILFDLGINLFHGHIAVVWNWDKPGGLLVAGLYFDPDRCRLD